MPLQQRQVSPMLQALMDSMNQSQQGQQRPNGAGMPMQGMPMMAPQTGQMPMQPQGQPQGMGLLNQGAGGAMGAIGQMAPILAAIQKMKQAGAGGQPGGSNFDINQMQGFMGGIKPDLSNFQLPPEFKYLPSGGGM